MHLEYGLTHPQRGRQLQGHQDGGFLIEDHVSHDKPPHWSGGQVPRCIPWFPEGLGDGDLLP